MDFYFSPPSREVTNYLITWFPDTLCLRGKFFSIFFLLFHLFYIYYNAISSELILALDTLTKTSLL